MYFRSFFIPARALPARALPVCMVTKKPSAVWESRPLTKTTKKTLYFYTVLNRVYIFYMYVYIIIILYLLYNHGKDGFPTSKANEGSVGAL